MTGLAAPAKALRMMFFSRVFVLLALVLVPAAARASDDGFEFWLNPSVETGIGQRTALELETAQRWRDAGAGRADSYFIRLWLSHKLSNGFTVAAALEQRVNDGGRDERRVIQQLSAREGIWRARLRLEQRFVEGNSGRMGLRARARAGVEVPLDAAGRWAAFGDAELFVTLRATSAGGDIGPSALRTQLGIAHEVSEHLALSLGYLRQEDFAAARPNVVGHAPIIGITWSF